MIINIGHIITYERRIIDIISICAIRLLAAEDFIASDSVEPRLAIVYGFSSRLFGKHHHIRHRGELNQLSNFRGLPDEYRERLYDVIISDGCSALDFYDMFCRPGYRMPEIEKAILKGQSWMIVKYGGRAQTGPWPEAEAALAKRNPKYLMDYVAEIRKSPLENEEIEKVLLKSPAYSRDYIRFCRLYSKRTKSPCKFR